MSIGWKRFFNLLHMAPKRTESEKNKEELLNDIIQARDEWQQAKNYFNNVNDDGLTDHAISLCQAAEQKYVYLLQLAKQEGLVNNNISIS